MSETHAGETLDHARSSGSVHCTRTGFPVSCDRIAASASAPSPPNVVRPYCPEWSNHRTMTFSTGMLSTYAIRARNPWDCEECVHIVAIPSLFKSATATNGPIGACRTYPCSYVAEILFEALRSAAFVSAALPLVSDTFPNLCARIAFVM